MESIFSYDWFLFIIVGTIVILTIRASLHLHPVAAPFPLLVANLPWLMTGLGVFLHPDRDVFGLFDLRLGMPAYALLASIVIIWITLLRWLFKSGAEQLAASDQVRRLLNVPENPISIKLLAIACVMRGVIGISMMVLTATGIVR